ncbi:hypothetical protein CYY_007613 [Polysphondylium violaceum]|uniref:Uncharacterized protein n=1 Tax=Polysphondylium violaceum TaxID=133409 RepID=A0A8J4PRM8_9MYCE|nr:hypothetical protein CYY_007613 [Polysphondylium violaceum]
MMSTDENIHYISSIDGNAVTPSSPPFDYYPNATAGVMPIIAPIEFDQLVVQKAYSDRQENNSHVQHDFANERSSLDKFSMGVYQTPVNPDNDIDIFQSLSHGAQNIVRLVANQKDYSQPEIIFSTLRAVVNHLAPHRDHIDALVHIIRPIPTPQEFYTKVFTGSLNYTVLPDKFSSLLHGLVMLTSNFIHIENQYLNIIFNLFQHDSMVIKEILNCIDQPQYGNPQESVPAPAVAATPAPDLMQDFIGQLPPVPQDFAPAIFPAPVQQQETFVAQSFELTPADVQAILDEVDTNQPGPTYVPQHMVPTIENNKTLSSRRVAKTPSKNGISLTIPKCREFKRLFPSRFYRASNTNNSTLDLNNPFSGIISSQILYLLNTIYQPFPCEISTKRIIKPHPIIFVANHNRYSKLSFKLRVVSTDPNGINSEDAFACVTFEYKHSCNGEYRFEIAVDRIDARHKSCKFIFELYNNVKAIGPDGRAFIREELLDQIESPSMFFRNTPSDFDNPTNVGFQRDLAIPNKYHAHSNHFKKGKLTGKPLFASIKCLSDIKADVIIPQSDLIFESTFWISFICNLEPGEYSITLAYTNGKTPSAQIPYFVVA